MLLEDLEIPQLVSPATRPAQQPLRSAKPGPARLVRWTRYGAWSDDGLTVHNEHGAIIYRAGQVLQPANIAARKLAAR